MLAADLEEVYRLECVSQQDPWSRQHFVDELKNPVASIDLYWRQEQLAGFLCSWLIAGELQIQNLATCPALRRNGIAARLLHHVVARSRQAGLTSICLEVRVSNHPAIALYTAFGFVPQGSRRAYYSDGEDALVMTYRVPPVYAGSLQGED